MPETKRVRDVMNRNVATIRDDEETTVADLLKRFGRYRHVPVVNRNGQLVGMLTRTDLLAHAVARGKNRRRRVTELASGPVVGIAEDETIQAAAARMIENGVHALPVTSPDGRLMGLVTDDEILEAVVGEPAPPPPDMDKVPVEMLMTRDPITVSPDTTLGDAAGTMLEVEVRHLPVIDDDLRLVGILSDRDLRSRLGTDLSDWESAPPNVREEVVGDIMIENPTSLRPGVSVRGALDAFADDRIGALPIIDEQERLLGMLSYVDLLVWMRDLAAERPAEHPAH